jgi:hypothetical protein
MIVASTVTLILYLIFIFVEKTLYTTTNFDSSDVPWACRDPNISVMKAIKRLLIAASFMLDKYGRKRKECALVISALTVIIVICRLRTAKCLDWSIHIA